MPESLTLDLPDPEATEAFGRRLGEALGQRPAAGLSLWLEGELGAGKTTLVRACLRALGHAGRVPSTTYTLVEPYATAQRNIYHLDLYRLADAEELEFIGARDYFAQASLSLIEWPERGTGFMPQPDLSLCIEYVGEKRRVRYASHGARGAELGRYLDPTSSGVE